MCHTQRLARAGIGGDVPGMAAHDRLDVSASAVDREMHGHLERRLAVACPLMAPEVEFDQFGVGHQSEGAARRYQEALRCAKAGAHMAKAFDNAKMRQHPTSGQHFLAQRLLRVQVHCTSYAFA